MNDLLDMDSAMVKTPEGKTALAVSAPDIPLDVNVVSGAVTITAGDISVENVTLDPASSTKIEPGVSPIHSIIDSGSSHVVVDSGNVEVSPGDNVFHSIINSGAVQATIPERSISLALGKVQIEPGAAALHSVVDSGHIIVDSVDAQVKAVLDSQASFSADAVKVTTYQDDYITQGKAFQIQIRLSFTANQNRKLVFDFSTANGKMIYTLPIFAQSTNGLFLLDTYIASSYAAGTVITPLNVNALSANSSLSTVKEDVSSTGQTNLRQYTVGTKSTNQSSGGGALSQQYPKIFTNEKLVCEIVNQESAANVLALGFTWFEI